MSLPIIDLTGQRFGRLTVLKLSPNRGRHGEVLWLCKCGCGKTLLVSSANLRYRENTRSCGCLKREHPGTITKKAARAEHKAKEVIIDGGEEWYAPRKTVLYVNLCTYTTLQKWAKKGCPALGGKRIRTRRFAGGYNQKHIYYAKKSLDEVKDALATLEPIPRFPGFLYIDDAATELNCHVVTVYRLMKKSRVNAKRVRALGKDGWMRRRTYVPESFVEEYKANLAKKTAPDIPGFVHINDAAANLDCTVNTLQRYMRNDKLKSKRVQAKVGDRRIMPRAYVPQSFVEKVRGKLLKGSPSTVSISGENWVPIKIARKELGMPEGRLRRLLSKRKLDWRRIPAGKGPGSTGAWRGKLIGISEKSLMEFTGSNGAGDTHLSNGLTSIANGQALGQSPEGRPAALSPRTAPEMAKGRGRPTATAKHRQWKKEHDDGKSYAQIAMDHNVTRRAVIKALAKYR